MYFLKQYPRSVTHKHTRLAADARDMNGDSESKLYKIYRYKEIVSPSAAVCTSRQTDRHTRSRLHRLHVDPVDRWHQSLQLLISHIQILCSSKCLI